MMKHSSNTKKYIVAAILGALVAWMSQPASAKGQGQHQNREKLQAQSQTKTHAQQPWQDLPPKQFHRIMQTNPRAALTDTLSPQTPLLIYCGAEERSTTVCEMLTTEMGFKNVFRLKGGLHRRKKQNLPLDQTSLEAGS